MDYVIYSLIGLGSALMLCNIFCFVRFAHKISTEKSWEKGSGILHLPITLLVLFLAGYIVVGIGVFGKPNIVMAGILFGGSVFVFVMYVLLDRITKKITEQEEVKAKLMAIEKSDRMKNEFMSGVSHEMRTPINIILGLCTMVMTDPSLSPETKERMEKIDSSTRYLLGMINNILDLKSIETGEFTAKKDVFSLDATITQIDSVAQIRCEKKGLDYVCRMEDAAKGKYVGDEARIVEVLLNLLDNAVKYTDKGGSVEFDIKRAKSDGGSCALRFSVKDTGIGMDGEFLPKVFDAFAKEDTGMTSSHGGSGLSLAVTKSIVELLGGKIEAFSEKNVGSEFVVTLPLTEFKDDGAEDEEASLDGKRVLIVEDIPENAEIVADLLDLEGVKTEHAENGKIAVDMFSASADHYYDAILMDLRMPVMDGLSATRSIRGLERADAKAVPIIALSANAFESDIKESFAAGMNAHIAKPADAELLYSVLKKNIGRYLKERVNKG
ncbi:MAG: response regulator [Clostridia bacterium]|nr:response regulator [Clostridia bacterium]